MRPALEAILIRPASTADIPGLERLITASVRVLSRDYYTTDEIEAAIVEVFGVDTQLISDGTYFLAEAGDELVGCGGWSKRQTLFGSDVHKSGAEDDLLDPAKDAARIRVFCVHPDWARRGVAKRILLVCEEAARSAGFTRVELVATLPGQHMYAAVGYAVIEPTVISMSKNRSFAAFLMMKEL